MSFYTGDAPVQQPATNAPTAPTAPTADESNEVKKNVEGNTEKSTAVSSSSTSSSKRRIESHAFVNQFSEVEKAISNFTKHQPFNHHYAPNVHPNRNHNNHYNNNRFNNNGLNNGRFHQQSPMIQQFKPHQQQHQSLSSQQQQQLLNGNATGLQNRFQKFPVVPQQQIPQQNAAVFQQQQQQQLLQQYQAQVQAQAQAQSQAQAQAQAQAQQQQVSQVPQVQSQIQQPFLSNDLKFDMFQQPQDISIPLRNLSPTFSAPIRPNSVNSFPMSAPLEQINTGSSFGLTAGSDMISTPVSNPVLGGVHVDNNISLDDSTTYLGDLWGNSKNLRTSASVWA